MARLSELFTDLTFPFFALYLFEFFCTSYYIDASVCDCTNAGGDTDGDGICDDDDFCREIFNLTNNQESCVGDQTERFFQAQVGIISCEINELPGDGRRLQHNLRQPLNDTDKVERKLQGALVERFGLAFPNETPELFYSWSSIDITFHGPIPLREKESILSEYRDGYFCFYIRKNPWIADVSKFDYETISSHTAQGRKLLGTFESQRINNANPSTWVWGTCMLYWRLL